MRRLIFVLFLILLLTAVGGVGQAEMIKNIPKEKVLVRPELIDIRGRAFARYLPDLVIDVSGPVNVAAGDDISIAVTVGNEGTAPAPGSADNDYWKSYYVDIILSQDASFPVAPAVQPVYAGATIEDFVEDMLMAGGRISNTVTLAKNTQHVYNLSVHIPKEISPGEYYLAVVADPYTRVLELREGNNTGSYLLNIYPPRPPGATAPSGVNFWVMPYAVGDTTINLIKPNGLIDYRDGISGEMMNNAPFGGRLGFRLGFEQHIPMPQIAYYRFLYKKDGTSLWKEFTEAVGVHYVREMGGVVSFPVLQLGPEPVNSMNLYHFRPHDPPDETPAVTYWPTTDWFGDIYAGFLKTQDLEDGKYTIKVEIFNNAGVQVMPTGLNNFIVPNGVGPGGTINTRVANASTEIDAGGFIFPLTINNTPCSGYIDAPAIGSVTASDDCGFLLYDSTASSCAISFDAIHPSSYAIFNFRIYRGINLPVNIWGEVAATSVTPFSGDGAGAFWNSYTVANLLSPACPTYAAFSENLHVYAKATTGWRQRINQYDYHMVRAFALAPGVY